MLAPAGADPPPVGTIISSEIGMTLVCQDQTAVLKIGRAAIDGGVKGLARAMAPYAMSTNEIGEPLCGFAIPHGVS